MKRLIRFTLFITLITMLLSSCRLFTKNPGTGPEEPANTPLPTPIVSLGTLFEGDNTLTIKKDSVDYKAPLEVGELFLILISKGEVMSADTGSKSPEANKYDMVLKYSGNSDILISTSDNTFFYDNNIYRFWGDCSNVWKSLKFDTGGKTLELAKEALTDEIMSKSYREDIDGDGTPEEIKLIFRENTNSEVSSGRDLVLKVNDKSVKISDSAEWRLIPYHTVNTPPGLSFFPVAEGTQKLIIVNTTYATLGIGSSGNLNAFAYKKEGIDKVKVEPPVLNVKYKKSSSSKVTAAVEAPAQSFSKSIEIDMKENNYLKGSVSLNQIIDDLNGGGNVPHVLEYVTDNGSLSANILLYNNSRGRMHICNLTVSYEYKNQKLVPKGVAFKE